MRTVRAVAKAGPVDVPIKELVRDSNVRAVVEDQELSELAQSIKQFGVLEPVLVELEPDYDNGTGKPAGRIRLVAGYRRVRAAELAGLRKVPAIISPGSPVGRPAVQFIENDQRKDLLPIEQARNLQQLVNQGLTQDQVGKKVGRSQPYVANRLRLLKLPAKGLELMERGRLSQPAAEKILALGEERAQKTVLDYAARLVKESGLRTVTERDLEYALRDAWRRVAARQELEQARKNAKFPNCPVKDCGKIGNRIPWDASRTHSKGQKGVSVSKLADSNGHEWSTVTGKREVRRDVYGESRPAVTERKAPTLAEVSPFVELDPSVTVDRIAERLFELPRVGRTPDGEGLYDVKAFGTSAVCVSFVAKLPKDVPAFDVRSKGKKIALEFQGAESWNQQTDAGRIEAAKRRVRIEAWVKETFPKRGRKPNAPAAPPLAEPAAPPDNSAPNIGAAPPVAEGA